jgi:hypothetical protein
MLRNLEQKPVNTNEEVFKVSYKVPDLDLGTIPHLLMYSGSSTVMAPVFEGRSVPQNTQLELDMRIFRDPINWKLYHRYKEFYSPIVGRLPMPYFSRFESDFPFSGNLCPLDKDGSWKIRWIASPVRIHQMALKPLGDTLFSLLRRFPWDCTFDQKRAVPILQKVLQEGRTIHSIDLESATDNFPLNFQLHLLRQLNSSLSWQRSLDLFRDLARGEWRSDSAKKYVRWTKGQPMGLYPSFPAFAVTHGLLLKHLDPRERFLILGDDVVIWDDKTARKYREILVKWSVPISSAKSFSSSILCEFAGMVITERGVFHNFKWKDTSDDNFMEQMRQFGKRFRRALTWRQQRVYDKIAHLQPPIGCHHGVDSTNIVKSIQETDEWLSEPDERGSRCMGFFDWCKNQLSLAKLLPWRTDRSIQRTFDKKVLRAIDNTRLKGIRGNLNPFRDVVRAARVEPDTPNLFVFGKVRPTALELYERRLDFRTKRTSPNPASQRTKRE